MDIKQSKLSVNVTGFIWHDNDGDDVHIFNAIELQHEFNKLRQGFNIYVPRL